MIFKDGDVFDDDHVDFGEDLRGDWDEDRWNLIHDVLIKA